MLKVLGFIGLIEFMVGVAFLGSSDQIGVILILTGLGVFMFAMMLDVCIWD